MRLGLKGRALLGLLFVCLCVLALIGVIAQTLGAARALTLSAAHN
jgi:hypothetical protein